MTARRAARSPCLARLRSVNQIPMIASSYRMISGTASRTCDIRSGGVSTAAIVLAAVLLGGTFMGLTALGLIAARERGTGDPRARLGLMTAVFSAGQIVGPAFAGYIYDLTGSLTLPSLAAAGALTIAAALSLFADRS